VQLYLTATYSCSYLAAREARSQVVAPSNTMDVGVYSELLQYGFRRSGLNVYRPGCDACQACVSVRVPVAQFEPSRGQRRCKNRNADLTLRLLPLAFEEAHYRLYHRYQVARHAGCGMDQDDREQFSHFLLQSRVDSLLLEFSLAGEVVMVALVDQVIDGLSAVYTFFDPDLEKRGLGVFSILTQIRLAQEIGLPYVYLGYWIEACGKMSYKRGYRPLEALLNNRWQKLE
jgi:arginine-tRNA-protein transferase